MFRGGLRVERPSLVMLWRETRGPCRVGFAVSRQLGGAVVRNRARRRLRAAYRAARMPGLTGLDLVIVARRAALSTPFATLVRDVDGGLHGVARGGGRG